MTRQWALILFVAFLVVMVIDLDQHHAHPAGVVLAVAIVVLLVFAF